MSGTARWARHRQDARASIPGRARWRSATRSPRSGASASRAGRNVRGEHRSGRLVPDGARWRSAVGPARASGSRWRSARVCSGRWTRRPPPPRPAPRRHHHRRRWPASRRARARTARRPWPSPRRAPRRRSDVPLRGARAGDGDGGRGGGGGGGGGDVRRRWRSAREGAVGVHAQRRAGRHRVGARALTEARYVTGNATADALTAVAMATPVDPSEPLALSTDGDGVTTVAATCVVPATAARSPSRSSTTAAPRALTSTACTPAHGLTATKLSSQAYGTHGGPVGRTARGAAQGSTVSRWARGSSADDVRVRAGQRAHRRRRERAQRERGDVRSPSGSGEVVSRWPSRTGACWRVRSCTTTLPGCWR